MPSEQSGIQCTGYRKPKILSIRNTDIWDPEIFSDEPLFLKCEYRNPDRQLCVSRKIQIINMLNNLNSL